MHDGALAVSSEKFALMIAPNPTESSIDIFPINEIMNRNLKMTLFQTNGTLLVEKEGYWQEIKPLLDAELERVGEGYFLLDISYENFSKTFKIINN